MKESITYVALDTHKKEHQVAMLLAGEDQIRQWRVLNRKQDIHRMVKRIQKQARGVIQCCYEAGPCGFDLQRRLVSLGVECRVIAPSLIPRKPGERIKTDRRDARKLLEYQRAGMLTEVHPPSAQEEAIRDLCRCRESVKKDHHRAQHRLLKFLLRRGFYYSEGKHWTQKHLRWLRSLKFEDRLEELVFSEYLGEVYRQKDRLELLDKELKQVSQREPYREGVGVLRCFHGIDTITAMVIVSELFGFERFNEPRQLMSFLGLIPGEHSSGERSRKGGITKTGNNRVRRVLIEAAWHYRHKPTVGKPLKERRKGQPLWAIEQAEKARKRLYRRYWRLMEKGKSANEAVVAVARELAGFLWAILHALVELAPGESLG
jgi:transposase